MSVQCFVFGQFEKMNVKIWRILAQILSYNNDPIEIIKPFFENLKNENSNDEKFISHMMYLKFYIKKKINHRQMNQIFH